MLRNQLDQESEAVLQQKSHHVEKGNQGGHQNMKLYAPFLYRQDKYKKRLYFQNSYIDLMQFQSKCQENFSQI